MIWVGSCYIPGSCLFCILWQGLLVWVSLGIFPVWKTINWFFKRSVKYFSNLVGILLDLRALSGLNILITSSNFLGKYIPKKLWIELKYSVQTRLLGLRMKTFSIGVVKHLGWCLLLRTNLAFIFCVIVTKKLFKKSLKFVGLVSLFPFILR